MTALCFEDIDSLSAPTPWAQTDPAPVRASAGAAVPSPPGAAPAFSSRQPEAPRIRHFYCLPVHPYNWLTGLGCGRHWTQAPSQAQCPLCRNVYVLGDYDGNARDRSGEGALRA